MRTTSWSLKCGLSSDDTAACAGGVAFVGQAQEVETGWVVVAGTSPCDDNWLNSVTTPNRDSVSRTFVFRDIVFLL
jgi:hypothetical protein